MASLEQREDLVQRADVRICAFDIETTKLPLQFPNAEFDQARPPLALLLQASLDHPSLAGMRVGPCTCMCPCCAASRSCPV